MKRFKLKKLKRELQKLKEDNGMSINKFLIRYFGIKMDKLKISHSDICILLPNLERLNLDTILKNKDLVYSGSAVLIIDSYGNLQCYITPEINEYEETVIKSKIKSKNSAFKDAVISEDLSRYELSVLCKHYKDIKDFSRYRIVRDLLKEKKDEVLVEKYKNKKLKLIMKGREEDD